MSIKRVFFWVHLAVGIVSGVFIGLLALTGASIAFEPQLIEFAQKDVTRVTVSDAPRLPIETLLKKTVEQVPDFTPAGVVVQAEPDRAVLMPGGRGKPSYYVNPYTGEVKEQGAAKTRAFIAFMTNLHRWLALPGGPGERSEAEQGVSPRDIGRIVTGSAALAFASLCVTGLVIWWPRQLNRRVIRPSVWFLRGAKGKVRDWNWHNVFGFWGLPVIATLAVTGAMLGFPWARALLYYAVGEKPPVRGESRPGMNGPGQGARRENAGETRREENRARAESAAGRGENGRAAAITPPAPDAKPIGYDAALAVVTQDTPDWESVSFRSGNPGAGARGGRRAEGARRNPEGEAGENRAPRGEDAPGEQGGARRRRAAGTAALNVTVKRAGVAPLFANVAYTLNPYTGEIMKRESFADKSPGEKLGGSVKAVHTGEAFGWFGRTAGFLGSLVALILVYTGFALSWRRFFPGKKRRHHQHRGPETGNAEATTTPAG